MAGQVHDWPLKLLLACAIAHAGCTETVANPIRVAVGTAGEGGTGGTGPDAGVPERDSGRPPPWMDSGPPVGNWDVPPTPHCAEAAVWNPDWAAAEQEFFNHLNALRMRRPRCGREQPWGELQPLRLDRELRCSARLHSKDMVERGFEGIVNLEGLNPAQRAAAAGFEDPLVYERIDDGGIDVTSMVEQLRNSSDYCMILANPAFRAVGLGLYQWRWTLDFAVQ